LIEAQKTTVAVRYFNKKLLKCKMAVLTYVMFVVIFIVGKLDHTIGALKNNNKRPNFKRWTCTSQDEKFSGSALHLKKVQD